MVEVLIEARECAKIRVADRNAAVVIWAVRCVQVEGGKIPDAEGKDRNVTEVKTKAERCAAAWAKGCTLAWECVGVWVKECVLVWECEAKWAKDGTWSGSISALARSRSAKSRRVERAQR